MDFGLSEEQQLLAETLGRYLKESVSTARVREIGVSESGHDAAIWKSLAEIGIAGILIDEQYGGSGLGVLDAVVAAEVLGYHCTPAPFLSTAMASVALGRAGSPAMREQWLPKIAAGEPGLSVAIGERISKREDAGVRVQADELTGKALFALDSNAAEGFIVAVDDGRMAVVAGDAPGLSVECLSTIDSSRRTAELSLQGVAAEGWLGERDGALTDTIIDVGRVILAADILGASQRALDLAVAYAGERKQFERVIGSFQAVKHMCSEMAAEIEPARSLLWYAGHAFDEDSGEASLMAAHAKAHLSEVGRFVSRTATEVHGGIGFTEECDVQLFFKRVGVDRALLGSPEQLRERAAQLQGWVVAACLGS
jgi:alkylation response protein AidB-like acyl-CoA dehydrogenase